MARIGLLEDRPLRRSPVVNDEIRRCSGAVPDRLAANARSTVLLIHSRAPRRHTFIHHRFNEYVFRPVRRSCALPKFVRWI
ncbi:hypothetical protein BRD01_13060 [Halobacteriales archaeon QS_8_65_32]|nr:MAG: hypothetical protein BRD01_13060 [Halobacteriales archaeon QS_8_65_32]